MKLQDRVTIYERLSTSDGAGGRTPGTLSQVTWTWGNVKPMSGFIGMTFQNINGTQGYEVIIRTDFDFPPEKTYYLGYEGIYGEVLLLIHSVQIDKYYTKLTCKSENKPAVQTT
jgi:hypothetical protein